MIVRLTHTRPAQKGSAPEIAHSLLAWQLLPFKMVKTEARQRRALPQKVAASRRRLKKFVEVLLEPAQFPFYALKVASAS
jgi:hypothetical protein